MIVLVLGGNGFIGSHVVDQLLAEGHTVRVFDRSYEKFRTPLAQVDYRIAPFDDIASLAEALQGVDVVCHMISTTVPSTSNKDPIYDIESNLVATIRLLNLMRESGVARIVYLSSGGTVYGIPESSPILESHSTKPICSYGIVKVAIENYLHMYYQLYGLNYTILRISNPYGERQGHTGVQGVIGTFLQKILTNEQIEVWGDGSIVRDFIYIGDLAELCVSAIKVNNVGIYNGGSGVGYSINEVIETMRDVTGKSISPKYISSRGYDVPKVILDNGEAKKTFGWTSCTDLNIGLSRTWRWLCGVSGI